LSREATERGIGALLERQRRLNVHLVLGFIRSQIDFVRKTSDEAQNEVSEVSGIDKITEIIDDLTLDLGEYSFHDLLTALNEEDFSEERKAMFNACLDLIGIRDDGLA